MSAPSAVAAFSGPGFFLLAPMSLELCDSETVWHDHAQGLPVLRPHKGKPRRFALVRDPVKRVVAGYAALRAAGELGDYADINAFCAALWRHLAHPFFAPQHRFVLDETGRALCPWVREGDAAKASRLTQQGYEAFALSAPAAQPEGDDLSLASRQLIGEFYHRDFRLFGYAPPSPATAKMGILDAAAGRAPALVFWTERFREIYRLWRARHDAYSVRPVLAIEVREQDAPARKPLSPWVLHFSAAALPEMGTMPPDQRLHRSGGLWDLRMQIFFLLMVNAYDFVHFDADAFVLKPYDWMVARQRAPFLFSRSHFSRHVRMQMGFAGGCGFFAVRSARVPLRDAIEIQNIYRRMPSPDDQIAFNLFFLQHGGYALLPPEHCGLASFLPLPPRAAPALPAAAQRREGFWSEWGAEWYDRSHRLMVQILPLSLVARSARARDAGACIWHIKRFLYHPKKIRKLAGQGEAQWQSVLGLMPRWRLWLRARWLRVRFAARFAVRCATRRRWRGDSRF